MWPYPCTVLGEVDPREPFYPRRHRLEDVVAGLANKTILFLGDSLGRQLMLDLGSMVARPARLTALDGDTPAALGPVPSDRQAQLATWRLKLPWEEPLRFVPDFDYSADLCSFSLFRRIDGIHNITLAHRFSHRVFCPFMEPMFGVPTNAARFRDQLPYRSSGPRTALRDGFNATAIELLGREPDVVVLNAGVHDLLTADVSLSQRPLWWREAEHGAWGRETSYAWGLRKLFALAVGLKRRRPNVRILWRQAFAPRDRAAREALDRSRGIALAALAAVDGATEAVEVLDPWALTLCMSRTSYYDEYHFVRPAVRTLTDVLLAHLLSGDAAVAETMVRTFGGLDCFPGCKSSP